MVVLAHSGMDMEWACGHVGPAACRQCFDAKKARLDLAEAVCEGLTTYVDNVGNERVDDTWPDLMSRHRTWLAGTKEADDG